jgi:hypothetical protein
VKAPYPDHACAACDRGEQVIVPPYSSIVGQMGVHSPSGNVCAKWLSPDVLAALEIYNRKRRRELKKRGKAR